MTPSRCRAEIARLVGVLLEGEIALAANSPREQSRGRLVVVESPPREGPSQGERFLPSGCIDEYLDYLQRGDYTCVLSDGALLQLSFTFRRRRLIKHRLCFYPCPVLVAGDQVSGELSLQDLVEMTLAEKVRDRVRLRSPLRFDFDGDAARRGHSASHLHLAYTECRWPVYGPLSLGHFVRFVFRHFYPDLWRDHVGLRQWTLNRERRTVTREEEGELYIECQA